MAKAKPKDEQTDSLHAEWLAEIERYESESEKWEEKGKKVLKRYKDERGRADRAVKFNILWSNVQTLKPAVYSRDPIPRVKRRFKDRNPVALTASEILERCLSYGIECTEFGEVMRQSVQDRLLPGRGTSWVRYVPHFRDSAMEGTEEELKDGSQLSDDAESEVTQELAYEEAVPDYVHWLDFGHTYARTWEELRAVWRIAYMTRSEGIDRFGAKFKRVELDYNPFEDKRKLENKVTESMKRATVYEIWDKETKTVIWMTKGYDQILDTKSDPLELEDFFPCPKPMLANLANDSLIPIPDYCQYQDQADEIDELTARIGLIASAIKVAGAYDGRVSALGRLLTEGSENVMIAVPNWGQFAERGGLKGAMDLLPNDEMAKTLTEVIGVREKAKQDLYEITGISDIIRGFSDSNETATAQNIKSQYANMRLGELQREVQKFARDMLRIMGQIIAYKFTQETIAKISGFQLMTEAEKQQAQMALQQMQVQAQQMGQQWQLAAQQAQAQGMQPPPQPQPQQPDPKMLEGLKKPSWEQVMGLLRNHAEMGFSIEIETDSTVTMDEQADKAADAEMIQALGGFAQAMAPSIQMGITSPKVAQAIQNSMIRKYRFGRDVEEAIEEAEGQPLQTPQGDPKAQQQLQAAQQKVQQEAQANQQDRMKLDGDKMAHENDKGMFKLQQDHAKAIQQVQEQKAAVDTQSVVQTVQSIVDGFLLKAEGMKKDHEAKAKAIAEGESKAQAVEESNQATQAISVMQEQLAQIGEQVKAALLTPKKITRGADGRVEGVEPVTVQ